MAKKKMSKAALRRRPVPERCDPMPEDWDAQLRQFGDFLQQDAVLQVGFDPGALGAMVAVRPETGAMSVLSTPYLSFNAPKRTKSGNISTRVAVDYDRWSLVLARLCERPQPTIFVYENLVGYMVSRFVRAAGASVLGQQDGFLLGFLAAHPGGRQLSVHSYKPIDWKKAFKLDGKATRSKGSTVDDVYSATAALVRSVVPAKYVKFFPDGEEFNGRADAALVLMYHKAKYGLLNVRECKGFAAFGVDVSKIREAA